LQSSAGREYEMERGAKEKLSNTNLVGVFKDSKLLRKQ
jgi:hypothetical protein